jgi:hypothetical protein
MTFSTTESDGALVRVDFPESVNAESARVDGFVDAGWRRQETVAVTDDGLIEIPGTSTTLRRACFPSLGLDVACVLIPPHGQ